MHKFFTGIFILFLASVSLGQNTSTSPYSSYGIGDQGGLDNAVFSGIGNNTISFFDSTVVNYYNPSTYNSLGQGQTLFSIGLSSRFSTFSSGEESAVSKVFAMDHVALTIPVGKRFGMSLGLKPFSKRGYDLQSSELLDTDTIRYQYKGYGTTSEVYYGFSAYLLNHSRHKFSVGANVGYVFGTVINQRSSTVNDGFAGGIERKGIRLRSVHYLLAANYQTKLDSMGVHNLTLTGTYEPLQKMKAYYSDYMYFSANVNLESAFLILSSQDEKGKITMGSNTTVGFRYTYNPKSKLGSTRKNDTQLDFFASYNINDYSAFRGDFETFGVSYNYQNTNSLNLGIQYIPHRKFLDNNVNSNIFSIMRYRAGIYKASLPLSVGGQQISDFGTTFGFGIPILTQQSVSSINFGFTYGRRGRDIPDAVKENYLGVNFGITIAPSKVDRWFIKRKLD